MSFAEVLAAARELSEDERKELVRELAEPMPPAKDDPLMRQFLATFPPGTEIPYWKPELTAERWEQIQKLLAEMKETA